MRLLLRCFLVTVVVTAAAGSAVRLLLPSVRGGAPGFEGALIAGCAAIAIGCAAWGWLGAMAVVVEALGSSDGSGRSAVPGVPAGLRRAVLAACGVALASAGPALATPGTQPQGVPAEVAGLPFPARAMDLPATTHRVVVVRPGDSLWAITARRLAARAGDPSDGAVTAGWRALYARNRTIVGDDPSLIHPGQQLTLPDQLEEPE